MNIEHIELIDHQDDAASFNGRTNNYSDKPKVSIMIISYNQKEFVTEAIESSVNQNYENLEVVISDDGSTDGTAEIIAQLQTRYPKKLVALLNSDNVGITRNCNRALRACTGEFITFIGGDDVVLPGKITAQTEWFAQDQQRVLCGHAVQYISSDGSPMPYSDNKLYEGAGPETYIRRDTLLPCTSTMVRASAIPSHGFDEAIPIASDFLFWIEVLSTGGKFGYVDGVYALRRVHATNVTTLRRPEVFDDTEHTYRIVADRYPQYRELCTDMINKHVVYYYGVSQLTHGYKLAAREQFLKMIKRKPLYIKAWIRLLQTF